MEKHYCENEKINSICCGCVQKAKQAGVLLEVEAVVDHTLTIDPVDIANILTCIVENAMGSCALALVAQPRIQLQVHRKVNKLVITCTNACPKGWASASLPQVVSMERLQAAAASYNGACDFQAGQGEFTCRVLLNLLK